MSRLLWPAHQERPCLGKLWHGCAGTAPALCWSPQPELTGLGPLPCPWGVAARETESFLPQGLSTDRLSGDPFLTFPTPRLEKAQKTEILYLSSIKESVGYGA